MRGAVAPVSAIVLTLSASVDRTVARDDTSLPPCSHPWVSSTRPCSGAEDAMCAAALATGASAAAKRTSLHLYCAHWR